MAATGLDLFKVCRKIVGVARSYKEPASSTLSPPAEPILFLKAPTCLIPEGEIIKIPEGCTKINHEVELGVVIGKDGSHIPEDQALNHIGGYVLALDMTSGDHFADAAKNKHPWLKAKCFDTFCPISQIIAPEIIPNPDNVGLWLKVNGESRQDSNTSEMYFSVPRLISYTSKIMRLEAGDLLLTGTPLGINTVTAGDVITCGLKGIKEMKFDVK